MLTSNQTAPVDVVKAYLTAFGSGDIDAAVALLSDDVIWHIEGSANVFTIGLRRGPAAVREWLTGFSDHFVPRAFTLDHLIADGDAVIAIGRFRLTMRATGRTAGSAFGILFKVRDGRITRYQILEDSLILARANDPTDDVERLQSVKLNGLRYGLSDQGTGIAGPKALFLHGLFLNRHFFKPQVDTLTAAGWHCLSLDIPGHGDSQWRQGWALDDLTTDIALFVEEHVGAPVVVIGHSLGAAVAIRLAAQRPDLVKGLVSVNSTAQAEPLDMLPNWHELRAQLVPGDYKARRQALADIQARLLAPAFKDSKAELAERQLDVMVGQDPHGLVAGIDAVVNRGDIRPLLPTIKAPVLAIGGGEDVATPPDLTREIADLAADGQSLILPDVGHHAPLEAPQAVTTALRAFADRLAD